jgi:hypothetical protein
MALIERVGLPREDEALRWVVVLAMLHVPACGKVRSLATGAHSVALSHGSRAMIKWTVNRL